MSAASPPVDGLIRMLSPDGQQTTIRRVLASLTKHDLPLAARIDHAAAAKAAGMSLPPTDLLIFGNPKAGTPLMSARPSIAIDLPLKMLIQETPEGQTCLAYNDPAWLALRHGLGRTRSDVIIAMRELLDAVASDAVGPNGR